MEQKADDFGGAMIVATDTKQSIDTIAAALRKQGLDSSFGFVSRFRASVSIRLDHKALGPRNEPFQANK